MEIPRKLIWPGSTQLAPVPAVLVGCGDGRTHRYQPDHGRVDRHRMQRSADDFGLDPARTPLLRPDRGSR